MNRLQYFIVQEPQDPKDPKDPALTPEDRGCLGSPHCGSSAVAAVSARVDAAAGGAARGFGAIIIC